MESKSAPGRGENGKSKGFGDIFTDKRLKRTRARLIRVLRDSGNKDLAKTADAIERCGTWPAALKVSADGCGGFYRNQCRERLCPVCATLKGARHRAALVGIIDERLAQGARFTLLTLTFPHTSNDNLKDLLRILFKALALFRKTAFFRKHIRGWARGVEITRKDNGFHPHAHFIIEAGFLSIDALHAAWLKCIVKAGGRPPTREGVDVKRLKQGQGLNEAIGYPFKVSSLAKWPESCIVDLAEATKRRHMYQACRKWSRRIKEREDELEVLMLNDSGSEVILFRDFLEDLRQGDTEAQGMALSVLQLLASADGLEDAVQLLFDAMPEGLRRLWSDPSAVALCHAVV